jgi:hypothetical protein
MISAWTKHITDPSEKERFQNTILGSKSVLQRLQVLMNEMKEDVDTQELSIKIYDNPNWDHKQAHLNGFKEAIKKINRIINLDQKEIN